MMMVRSYLGPSMIEGLGIFAHADIKRGQLVWLYDARFDVSYDLEEIRRAPKHFQEFIDRYTYPDPTDPDRVVLDCDEGRFMNHADAPNIDLSNPARGIAVCDIPAGTELTCDYGQFMTGTFDLQPSRHRVGNLSMGGTAGRRVA